jgi:hypothetical protein
MAANKKQFEKAKDTMRQGELPTKEELIKLYKIKELSKLEDIINRSDFIN